MNKDYLFAILSIVSGIFGMLFFSKNREGKVSDSLLSNLNYWKGYLGFSALIIIGILWLLQLEEIINLQD